MKKKVVLTGAGGQLGKHFLYKLAESGFQVYAADIEAIQQEEDNKSIIRFKLDITDQIAVSHFYQSIGADLYAVINNAGIGVFTPFESRTLQEFRKVMDVNAFGTFNMCQGAVRIMKRQKYGKIINIASMYGSISSDPRIYGQSGRNNSEVYSMSKAAVIQLSKYLAANYARYNIQVNSISPGGIYNGQTDDFVSAYITRNPSGKMGKPNDVYSVIDFLLKEGSSYLTGQDLIVDGGHTVW